MKRAEKKENQEQNFSGIKSGSNSKQQHTKKPITNAEWKEKVRVIHTTAFGCNLICILRTLNEIVYAIFFSFLCTVSTKTRNDGRINVTA